MHIKGQTECFECKPKPVPKSFPVCTIRNTPDKPIHCIVWAKELLFQRLFGRSAWLLAADCTSCLRVLLDGRDKPQCFIWQRKCYCKHRGTKLLPRRQLSQVSIVHCLGQGAAVA